MFHGFQMSTLSEDLTSAVSSLDDFGHELRVGQVIRDGAWKHWHGGTYVDDVTGKPRQFDHRCRLERDGTDAWLAVECKNLQLEKPLIVCGTPRVQQETHHCIITTVPGSAGIEWRRNLETIYSEGEFVGKSLVRLDTERTPFKNLGDQEIYDKWAQALSSSRDLAKFAFEKVKKAGERRQGRAAVVLPVVVVPDNVLWKLEYSSNGTAHGAAQPVDSCEYFVDRRVEMRPNVFMDLSHVHFATLSGFKTLMSKLASNELYRKALFTRGV